jgi:hypothetical protein
MMMNRMKMTKVYGIFRVCAVDGRLPRLVCSGCERPEPAAGAQGGHCTAGGCRAARGQPSRSGAAAEAVVAAVAKR